MATKGTYLASVLPTADTPAWTKTSSATPTTESIVSGQLNLKTASGETCYYTLTDTGAASYTLAHVKMDCKWVSGDIGSSSQVGTFYAQLIAGGKCAGQIGVRNGTTIHYGYHNGTTWTYVDYTVASTSDAMHSYEVEFVNGTLYFRFDGTTIASYSGTHYTAATDTTYRFGDPNAGGTAPSEAYIDNVDYFGGTLTTKTYTADAIVIGTTNKTYTADGIVEQTTRTYQYEFPITVAGATNGSVIEATIPDWTDTYGNLRALSSGADVRVYSSDGQTEYPRSFSAGVVKWVAPGSASSYLIRMGRSDAPSPPSASPGATTVTATVGTRRTTSATSSTSVATSMTTAGATDVNHYGATATTGVENAQKFTVGTSGNLAKVGLWLKCQTDARPGDTDYSEWVTVRIETDSGGVPSGTVVGQLRVPYAVIKKNSAGYGEVFFHNRSTTYLDSTQSYWLVLSVPKNTSSNGVYWDQRTTSSSGTSSRSRSAGAWGSWGAADTAKSFRYEVYTGFQGAPPLPDVSITSERKPYFLPSALPSWSEQYPPTYGLNALLDDGTDKYFATWANEDSSNNIISSFAVKQSDRSVSTTTRMLAGLTDTIQKRVTAWWKNATGDYRAIATFKPETGSGYRRLHYVTGTGIENTAYTDGGELSIDVTDHVEFKFATRNIIGGQAYLYFDASLTDTLYASSFLSSAKPLRAKYNGTTGLTDFEYVEFDLDGVTGDIAQAWIYNTTRNGVENYIGFIFVQYADAGGYLATIYYAKSNDGVVFGPAKPLFTLGPETTLASGASAGATTISVTSASNLAIDDYIVLRGNSGSGHAQEELRKITNVVGTTLTLSSALTYAHASGREVARVDAGLAIAYSADFATPSAAKLWGYTAPATHWGDSDTTFQGVYPMQFSGDLSQLLSNTADYTADAVIVGNTGKTYTADALIFTRPTRTYTSDAVIIASVAGTVSRAYTADAIVKATITRTYSADAVIASATPEPPDPIPDPDPAYRMFFNLGPYL